MGDRSSFAATNIASLAGEAGQRCRFRAALPIRLAPGNQLPVCCQRAAACLPQVGCHTAQCAPPPPTPAHHTTIAHPHPTHARRLCAGGGSGALCVEAAEAAGRHRRWAPASRRRHIRSLCRDQSCALQLGCFAASQGCRRASSTANQASLAAIHCRSLGLALDPPLLQSPAWPSPSPASSSCAPVAEASAPAPGTARCGRWAGCLRRWASCRLQPASPLSSCDGLCGGGGRRSWSAEPIGQDRAWRQTWRHSGDEQAHAQVTCNSDRTPENFRPCSFCTESSYTVKHRCVSRSDFVGVTAAQLGERRPGRCGVMWARRLAAPGVRASCNSRFWSARSPRRTPCSPSSRCCRHARST